MHNRDDMLHTKTNSNNSMKKRHIFSFSQNVNNIYCHIIFVINEFLICYLNKVLHLVKLFSYC